MDSPSRELKTRSGGDPAIRDPKFLKLQEILRGLGRVLVAYSGGVDSAFLLKVAHDMLGDDAQGVLAHSESLDRNEYVAARGVAESMGISVRVIETDEYSNENYRRNAPDRCYHCKAELFDRLGEIAAAEGFPWVVDGSNFDDRGDYRPGMKAREERGVRSPLLEAELTKSEIRSYSRQLGLPTWDKPAAPCLSSRIPYGSEVTREKLRQVEAAEAGLRALGFRVLRVRHRGDVATIEIPLEEFSTLLKDGVREAAIQAVTEAGFRCVALDLKGFRSGSLNEALEQGEGRAVPTLLPPSEIRRLS